MKNRKVFWIIHRLSFVVLLLIWLAALFWMQPWDELKDYMIYPQNSDAINNYVYGSVTVEQTFIINGRFDSIDVRLGNYNNTQIGECVVRLYDASDRCVYKKEIDKVDLDDSWLKLNLGQSIYAELDAFRLEIAAPQLDKENCIVAYSSEMQVYMDGILRLNGIVRDQTLCFSVYRSRVNVFAWMALFVFLFSASVWWFYRKKTVLKSSFIILIGMGLCMMIMMAPLSAPDDHYHYNSALILSNVIMGEKDILQIPSDYCDYTDFVAHYNANSSFVRVLRDIFPVKSQSVCLIHDIGRSNDLQHPIAYLVPAVGITLGRILGLNFIWVYYIGRLFNLFLYIGLILLAVRIIPKYKELMLLTAALPMCLHQAVSYSYDVIINGTAFVFFAYVLYMAERIEKVRWTDIWILSAAGMIMCPVKIVYVALIPLVLLIPKEKFGNMKRYWLMSAFVLCCAAIFVVVVRLPVFLRILTGGQMGAVSVSSKYSVWYILDHPARFIKMMCQTILSSCISWVKLCIGLNLAGLTLPVSEYLICGFLLLLFLCCLKKDESAWMPRKFEKAVCSFVVCTGTILLVIALMTDTAYGSSVITGIQGRYFVPYIMPALFCVQTNKLTAEIDNKKIYCGYWFLQAGVMSSIWSNIFY